MKPPSQLTPRERRVIKLRIAGHRISEISTCLQCHDDTVLRILQRINQKLPSIDLATNAVRLAVREALLGSLPEMSNREKIQLARLLFAPPVRRRPQITRSKAPLDSQTRQELMQYAQLFEDQFSKTLSNSASAHDH